MSPVFRLCRMLSRYFCNWVTIQALCIPHESDACAVVSLCVMQPHHACLQGCQQFATDAAAVIAAFQPWTPRPSAHFRELCDAVTLLSLPRTQAQPLLSALEAAAASWGQQAVASHGNGGVEADWGVAQLLSGAGVTRLTLPTAMAVLERRLW